MRDRLSTLSAGIALVLALWTVPAAAVDVLRVGGTGSATALLAHLGEPFTQQTGITVEVIPNLGSGGGLNALAQGVLDLAISGRKLNPAELARGFVQVAAVRTPYVFVTSHPAPPGLTGREVAAAYSNARAAWPDGTPFDLILRPRSETDISLLAGMFPGLEAALNQARQRGDVPIAATDQDNADLAEKLWRSLTGATYTQVIMERRNLRMVSFDNVAPTLEAFESGAYPYAKVLRVIYSQQPSAAAERFAQFLRTDAGVRALREAGCLPGGE